MNPYPTGQCTWGAAEMCSCLQNTSKYGDFGNGGDWYSHAVSLGFQTDTQPHIGWLCSFAVEGWPDGPGDVGLCVNVNSDTITRYGVNWHLDGSWSLDNVSRSSIIGCFKAPCNCIASGNTVYTSSPQGATGCMTFGWNVLGQTLCFDGIVGLIATGGGLMLMSLGLVLLVIGTMSSRQRQQLGPGQQPPQEQTPAPETVQAMTPQQRDALILRARQRATARSAAYRQTQGYRERRVSRLKTGQEQATAAEGTPAGSGARVTNVRLKNRR